MKIGFIGVGNIGAPIAGQLLAAGHRLLVYDIRRAGADALLAAGAEWSESPGSLTAQCEVVATCLPGRPRWSRSASAPAASSGS